jgi:hypothetical protein
MLRLTAVISFIVFALSSLFTSPFSAHPGMIIVGGEYTVQPGEIRHGDALVLFAQVTIAEGGKVEGKIDAFGSSVVIDGDVAENVHSFASNLTVHQMAKIGGKVDRLDFIQVQFQLPSIFLVLS